MRYWWDAFPGRLEAEEEELRAQGIRVTRDARAFARGVVQLELLLPPDRWLATSLSVVYPDSFPYTKPEIFAPSLSLGHHQNPLLKNLCLLPRTTEHWSPSWTVARILREQLPKLTQALRVSDPNALRSVEVEQGEPATYYFVYEDDSAVLVDSTVDLGFGRIGLFALQPTESSTTPIRGRIERFADLQGRTFWSTNVPEHELKNGYIGVWVRVDEQPQDFENAQTFMTHLENRYPEIRNAPWKNNVQLFAIVFPEEVRHRTEAPGWLVIVRRRQAKQSKRHTEAAFVRVERAGVEDLAARYPDFLHLQKSTVAVFGLGCIGAPSALEFARSGVGTLHLLDSDVVDAGTTVRWPFGLSAAGRRKVKVLCEAIARDYPTVRLLGDPTRLGWPDQRPRTEREALDGMFEGADLVYDATGEPGLQYLLSAIARDHQVPYVCVSGTQGAWGGLVFRANHRPDAGCWWCFQAALDTSIPSPPADQSATVQPIGCDRLTYVGANFDMMEVALQGVRVAVATLLSHRGVPNSDYPWDVAVVGLRDNNGARIEPRWSVYDVAQNPRCPTCAR